MCFWNGYTKLHIYAPNRTSQDLERDGTLSQRVQKCKKENSNTQSLRATKNVQNIFFLCEKRNRHTTRSPARP